MAAHLAVQSLPAVGSPISTIRHLRVLYADDMPELRDVLRLSLGREGHAVECVADGRIALARAAEDPNFDLVITDHHMPNANGIDVVAGLRALAFVGKIMVFSSELSTAIAAEYRRHRVDRILYKPVYPSVLREALAELFAAGSAAPVSG